MKLAPGLTFEDEENRYRLLHFNLEGEHAGTWIVETTDKASRNITVDNWTERELWEIL